MRVAKIVLAIFVALALQTVLARFFMRGTVAVDLVLVVVTYVGLTAGPILGLLAGTLGGLAQDSLGSGIVGIGSLAKTTVGFLTGVAGAQFIVTQLSPRLLVFGGATVIQAIVVLGFGLLLGTALPSRPLAAVAWQVAGNALVGIALFQCIEVLPAAIERRRAARTGARVRRLRQ
jgi:rod shape-determining protein MreD